MSETKSASDLLTILIVDDSAMMRAMLKGVISRSGAPVGRLLEAGNGQEALALLEAEAVDVLFTDINMPVMDGAQLLHAANQRREWDHITRIVVSTDGSTARRVELSALKVRACVEKPFRPEVVRDVLCEVVGVRS